MNNTEKNIPNETNSNSPLRGAGGCHISIVSPVYRAENIVAELVKQIKESVTGITADFEIILVNDASPDNSWLKITEECAKDTRVKGINLSRNFNEPFTCHSFHSGCVATMRNIYIDQSRRIGVDNNWNN